MRFASPLTVLANLMVRSCRKVIVERARTRLLCWGDTAQVGKLHREFPDGFEAILGADVLYVAEAIGPLFATIKELLAVSPEVRNPPS